MIGLHGSRRTRPEVSKQGVHNVHHDGFKSRTEGEPNRLGAVGVGTGWPRTKCRYVRREGECPQRKPGQQVGSGKEGRTRDPTHFPPCPPTIVITVTSFFDLGYAGTDVAESLTELSRHW